MTQFAWKPAMGGALAALTLSLAAACSPAEDEQAGAEVGATQDEVERPLAAVLGDVDDLGTLSDAISEAEIASVFDGAGSYTLLAPNDAAFEKLGDRAGALMEEQQRPILIGILRNHVLPGHLTPDNIRQAIENESGPVTMTTLGDSEITFAQDGDTITASIDGHGTTRFVGSATEASNGVIIPLDTVLLPSSQS